MLGFSPFKKHANKFNYIPRYYDPEEERRAQRRAELLGESPEHAKHEYVPGQYVRTARTARAARREAERSTRSKRRFGVLLTGIVVLLLFFVVIYPEVDVDDAAGCGAGCPGCGRIAGCRLRPRPVGHQRRGVAADADHGGT